MVMGLRKSIGFFENENKIGGFILFDENGKWKTYTSESLKKQIKELH
jgi:thiamine biosynthesis lipoprotein